MAGRELQRLQTEIAAVWRGRRLQVHAARIERHALDTARAGRVENARRLPWLRAAVAAIYLQPVDPHAARSFDRIV